MDEINFEDLDLEQTLRICEGLMENEENNSFVCQKLLDKIALTDSKEEMKKILLFLSNTITPSSSTIISFTNLLTWHSDAKILLEYLPSMIGECKEELESVFETLKKLFSSEREYQLEIVGALSEIPLNKKMKANNFLYTFLPSWV